MVIGASPAYVYILSTDVKRKNCAMRRDASRLLFGFPGNTIIPRPSCDVIARFARRPPASGRMLINLLPDFFAVLESTDPLAAYQRYFDNHRRILQRGAR